MVIEILPTTETARSSSSSSFLPSLFKLCLLERQHRQREAWSQIAVKNFGCFDTLPSCIYIPLDGRLASEEVTTTQGQTLVCCKEND